VNTSFSYENFLIEKKKAGQFRVTWTDYMQIVTIHAAEDIVISDAWQPVVYDVRRAGTPMRYAEVEEGYRCWYSGGSILLRGKEMLPVCYSFLDFHYGGWMASWICGWGYHVPTYVGQEVKNYMGPEKWGWVYGGQRTYKPIPPEEGALFDPLKYEWSKEPGTPHPQGWRKDCGSIEERWSKVASWTTWPKYSDEYMKYWEKFRTA